MEDVTKQIGKFTMIFQLSKVNGGLYLGDHLPPARIAWPRSTWLQRRLDHLRDSQIQKTKAIDNEKDARRN